MAGHTTGRKSWRTFREPIENIQSLGLAEDGCPESQVILAKHLLEENDDSANYNDKARLGVYWLIKASEKGHEEATRMLQNCLETGRGINEKNIGDVRACLNMSHGEKVSREAARELFSSLSQGEDFVTSGQIIQEMRRCSKELSSDSDNDSLPDWRQRHEGSGEKLTEEQLVSAASCHSHGVLPLVLRSPPGQRSQFSLAVIQLADLSPCPRPLLALSILCLFGLEAILQAAPSFIYYASFFIMILTTCQVLAKKWEFNEFKQWSNLLVAWGCPETNSIEAQWSYCSQSARPCLLFLAALVVNLLFTPYNPSLPFSEITVLSTLVSLLTLYHFSWYKKRFDFLALCSFVVHLLARYPFEIDTVVSQYWRYLDVHVPTYASYIVGNSVEFCLNFRLFFYLLMPAILVKMAARDRWLGIFTSLLPHLVSLSWWQLAVVASNGVTQYGLIRSCLAVVGLVLFVPLAGFITVIVPVATLARFMTTHQVSTPVALASASFITVIYMGTKSRAAGKFFFFLQILMCLLSGWLLLNSLDTEAGAEVGMDWREYSNVCRGSGIEGQEACSRLSGVRVTWEGKVLSTRLAAVHNPILPVVNKLPQGVQEILMCMLGERFEDCTRKEDCHIPASLADRCHLANWNKYEYEIQVELGMNDGWTSEKTTGSLRGGHSFRNFSVSLSPGDRIWFSGRLTAPLSDKPSVLLLQADCLSCEPFDKGPPTPLPLIPLQFKPIFNFFFNPMAVIR